MEIPPFRVWTLSTFCVYIVYMPEGRHRHKEVAKALLEAREQDLKWLSFTPVMFGERSSLEVVRR